MAASSCALTAWACVVCTSVQSSVAHPFPPSRQRWGVASRCQALPVAIRSLLLLAAAGLDWNLPPAPVESRSAAVDIPHFTPKTSCALVLSRYLRNCHSALSISPSLHPAPTTNPLCANLDDCVSFTSTHQTNPTDTNRADVLSIHQSVQTQPGGLRSCARDMTNYSTFSDGNETGSEAGAMARYVFALVLSLGAVPGCCLVGLSQCPCGCLAPKRIPPCPLSPRGVFNLMLISHVTADQKEGAAPKEEARPL